jgi:glutathione S-transferase
MPASTDPVLYSFRRCPYAIRARLALAVSGTCYELREVKLSAKPQAMLAVSPKGTVPVLVVPEGKVIHESLDIMRWALANRDPEGWLARDDAALIAANDGPFKHDLDRYKYPERHGSGALVHRERGLMFLREIDGRLAGAGQLCGSARGLADAAIVPFVRQFAAVDREWFDTQPLPHLKAWLAGHIGSNLFDAIMMRVEPWSPGDPPVTVASSQNISSKLRSRGSPMIGRQLSRRLFRLLE